jgi:hypothetical protein
VVILAGKKKQNNMPTTPPSSDSLAQVHELNRLFLKSLQTRDAAALRDSGFPAGAVDTLRLAAPGQIDRLAEFPRALFDLVIEHPEACEADPPADTAYGPQQILELTILFSAWNICRDSVYHARLFFGLTPRAVHTLRTTPLSALPRLGLTAVHVRCAFTGSEWLWRELFTEARPEVMRRLILIALQPALERTGAADRVAEPAQAPRDLG